MPANRESFTKTEIRAGILVVSALVIGVLFVGATTQLRPAVAKHTYTVYFDDTIGLNRGAEVRYGGVRVGKVTHVAPDEEDRARIRVDARVTADTPVNEQSRASISQVTLTSPKHLAISTGSPDAPLLDDHSVIQPGGGDLFSSLSSAAGGLEELLSNANRLLGTTDADGNPLPAGEFGTLGDVLTTLDTLGDDLKVLLGVETLRQAEGADLSEIESVASLFEDGGDLLDSLDSVLAENRDSLREALDRLVELEKSSQDLIVDLQAIVNDNKDNIDKTFANLADITDTVSETAEELAGELETLAASLESTMDNAEQLTGSARQLLEDNTPLIEQILYDTQETMRDLREFARTLAEQPQAVLRGKSPTGRQ